MNEEKLGGGSLGNQENSFAGMISSKIIAFLVYVVTIGTLLFVYTCRTQGKKNVSAGNLGGFWNFKKTNKNGIRVYWS